RLGYEHRRNGRSSRAEQVAKDARFDPVAVACARGPGHDEVDRIQGDVRCREAAGEVGGEGRFTKAPARTRGGRVEGARAHPHPREEGCPARDGGALCFQDASRGTFTEEDAAAPVVEGPQLVRRGGEGAHPVEDRELCRVDLVYGSNEGGG